MSCFKATSVAGRIATPLPLCQMSLLLKEITSVRSPIESIQPNGAIKCKISLYPAHLSHTVHFREVFFWALGVERGPLCPNRFGPILQTSILDINSWFLCVFSERTSSSMTYQQMTILQFPHFVAEDLDRST